MLGFSYFYSIWILGRALLLCQMYFLMFKMCLGVHYIHLSFGDTSVLFTFGYVY